LPCFVLVSLLNYPNPQSIFFHLLACCYYTSAPVSSFCKSTTDGVSFCKWRATSNLERFVGVAHSHRGYCVCDKDVFDGWVKSHTHDVGLNNTKLVHWDDVCLIFQVAGTYGINL
ncbi:hypothetical protein LINPERHAP1_LOCUS22516, partial [Linum perenne]